MLKLSRLFVGSMDVSWFAQKASRAHVKDLSSPPFALSPCTKVCIGLSNTPTAPKQHKCFLFSQQTLHVSVIKLLPKREGSLCFGKKMPNSCQKLLVVEKQWHAVCKSQYSSNPSHPTCCNPLFLSFLESWLPPPICFVSSGPETLTTWPTWLLLLPKGLKKWSREKKKHVNCCKNPDSLGTFVSEMCG